eukprot:7529130-Alexandrium_andersonii.AAC.1
MSTPQLGRLWVDVARVSAQAGDAQRRLAASRRDGAVAGRAADYKHKRYGELVTPFILELGGRPSECAKTFMQKILHPGSPQEADCSWQGARAWGL